jgi:hypothetical protein
MSNLTGQETVCRFPAECQCPLCLDWKADEEDNLLDLEDRLDAAFERADERSERQGELIEMFRREI